VPAKDFVPAQRREGRLHAVADRTSNDGLRNTYLVVANREQYEVTGTPALLQFIHEIYALDYLRSEQVGGVRECRRLGEGSSRPDQERAEGRTRFFGHIGAGLKGGKSESELGAHSRRRPATSPAKIKNHEADP